MVLPAVFLVPYLPVSDKPVFRQQDEQVAGVEADSHGLVDDEHMAHVLFSSAHLVLTLENQDAVRNKHTVQFFQAVRVEPVQFRLTGKHPETAVDAVSRAAVK